MRKHIFKILLILPFLIPTGSKSIADTKMSGSHSESAPTNEKESVSLLDSSKINITTGFDDIIGVHPLMNEHYCFSGKFCWKTNQEAGTANTLVLPYAEVDIYTRTASGGYDIRKTTNTDSNGNFVFDLSDNVSLWENLSDYKLMVVLRSAMGRVYTRNYNNSLDEGIDFFSLPNSTLNHGNTDYYLAGRGNIDIEVPDYAEDSTASFTLNRIEYAPFTENEDGTLSNLYTGQFFQLFTMLQLYAGHAETLDSGISCCNLIYPIMLSGELQNDCRYQGLAVR